MSRLFNIGVIPGLLLFFLPEVSGQTDDIRFNHITQKEGLPAKIITSFLKDSKGHLWIGSFTGLYRYDGTHFIGFKKSRDSNSISSNNVLSLCEDRKGNIWGATPIGIFCYNPARNQFKNYSTINIGIGPGVENVVCDSSGNIWAGGIPGLLKYNAKGDSLEQVKANAADKNALTVDRIRQNCLMTDFSGNGLWIATREGLNYFDTRTGRFLNHKNQPESYLFNKHQIRALAKSPKGHYWMFDNNTRSIIGFLPGNSKPLFTIDISKFLPNAFGGTLFEDSQSRLWYSDYDSELLLIDYLNNNKIVRIAHQSGNPFSIGSNFFWKAIEDQDGTIWFGTLSDISTSNANHDFYKVYPTSKTIPELREKFAITDLRENPEDGTWWIATLQGNAIHYNPSTGKSEIIRLENAVPQPGGVMPGNFGKINFFRNLIIFNTSNGSWQWKPGYLKPIPFLPLPEPYSQYRVQEMATADQVLYWLTNKKSLLYWNSQTGKIREYTLPDSVRSKSGGNDINMLHIDVSGKVWMQNGIGGFAWIEPGGNQINPVPFNMPKEKSRASYYSDFSLDKDGNIWFAYIGQGLYKYDVTAKKFSWWDESFELSRNQISTTGIDDLGQVWCFRFNEVSVFVPASNTFYEFSLPYGNAAISYLNISTKLSNGHILSNIEGDLVEFFPEKIISTPKALAPTISQVDISGKKRVLYKDSLLSLEPEENFLTFRFGTLTDQQLFPHSIEYMLEGIDPAWRTAGPANEASYTKLPPGKYTFKVVVVGRNKAWKSAEQMLVINIRTPLYNTFWFRALAVLLAGGFLYGWYRERMNHQVKLFEVEGKAQMLQKEKTLVQYENLKQHLNPHFLFNSLSSLSSLIEIDPKMAGKFLGSLSKIYRYILQSKDKDTVPLKDELNFVQSFIALQQTRFETGLQVNIDIDEDYYQKHIVPVTLQNLLENAIKHNIIDDENILVVDIGTEGDYLVVKNRMQLKKFVETSNQQGLENLRNLYTYLSERPLEYKREDGYFVVRIPLL